MDNYITEVELCEESKSCFLTYADEVLTDRAIPYAEDGLLSAQRKILWTMEEYLKMSNKGKTKKCNAIVGSTLATSYYHGDAACYGVLTKMAQPYLMRYPLVEGQGSLGTQEENGMVASSRYTEAKPSIYADLMFTDFKKNIVPLKETYNGEFMEPIVLPALLPNALVNGREAIGIAMSHNSLPNNLTEVCNGLIHYIKANRNLTIEEIMEDIKGPDFPLGGTIINQKDIKAAYATGRSNVSLKVRGDYEIKDNVITFTSIPYRTYRKKIREDVAKNIDVLSEWIDDFNDESNMGQNKLVFICNKNVDPNMVVNKLFALTDLQTTLSYNMNFIVNGTPKLCSLKDLMGYYIDHQIGIIFSIAKFDKDKAEARAHIIRGLLVAIDQIDEVIRRIKASESKKEAIAKLIDLLAIDEVQANAILDMKLGKLTRLDKEELVNELKEQEAIIAECIKIINDEAYRNELLIKKITELRDKYGDDRRTKLANIEIPKEPKEVVEVIPEDVVVIATGNGSIRRVPVQSFRTQSRNGKGVKSIDDTIMMMATTNTVDSLMVFTSLGKMYKMSVNDIPETSGKGVFLSSLLQMDIKEKVIAVEAVSQAAKYIMFFTKKGTIKKTSMEEFSNIKRGGKGIIAIKFAKDDSLANVSFLQGDEPVTIITKQGMSITCPTDTISPIGRVAMGVKGIKLNEDDEVLKGLVLRPPEDEYIAIFTENGFGKKVAIKELSMQQRGGKGIIIYPVASGTGPVTAATTIDGYGENMLIAGQPNSICVSDTQIPLLSRTSIGNSMIKNSKIIDAVHIG